MSNYNPPPLSLMLAGVAATLGAAVAMVTLSVLRNDSATAEGFFLAWVACCSLLALLPGALRGARVGVSLWATLLLLVTLAHWVLPSGSLRGGTLTVILASAAIVSLWRGFAAADGFGTSGSVALGSGWVVCAAVGVQALLKCRSLLANPGERSFLIWLLMAAAGGVLTLLLARRSGEPTALLATGVAVLAGGGFSGTVLVTLAALTWATELAERRPGHRGLSLGVLLLAIPLLWDPVRGALVLLAALALILGRRWIPVLFVGAGLLMLAGEPRSWPEVLTGVATLLILVPALIVPGRGWRPAALAAIAIAIVGLRLVPASQSLPAPAMLGALVVLGPKADSRQVRSAAVWIAALLGWSCIRSGYPWLRTADIVAAVQALGLPASGALAMLAVVLVAVATTLGARGGWRRNLAVILMGGALLAPPAWRWLRSERFVEWPPVIVAAGRPGWSQPLPPGAASWRSGRLVLDSALAYAAGLEAGEPVLEVRLRGPSGTRSWTLFVGTDTGEWAAAREGSAAPQPWSSWVDASGRFFGQRYRTVVDLGEIPAKADLEIGLAPGVADGVEATLYRVALLRVRGDA